MSKLFREGKTTYQGHPPGHGGCRSRMQYQKQQQRGSRLAILPNANRIMLRVEIENTIVELLSCFSNVPKKKKCIPHNKISKRYLLMISGPLTMRALPYPPSFDHPPAQHSRNSWVCQASSIHISLILKGLPGVQTANFSSLIYLKPVAPMGNKGPGMRLLLLPDPASFILPPPVRVWSVCGTQGGRSLLQGAPCSSALFLLCDLDQII